MCNSCGKTFSFGIVVKVICQYQDQIYIKVTFFKYDKETLTMAIAFQWQVMELSKVYSLQ